MAQTCCWVCVLLSEGQTLKMIKAVFSLLTKQAEKHWKLELDLWLQCTDSQKQKEKYGTDSVKTNDWSNPPNRDKVEWETSQNWR